MCMNGDTLDFNYYKKDNEEFSQMENFLKGSNSRKARFSGENSDLILHPRDLIHERETIYKTGVFPV